MAQDDVKSHLDKGLYGTPLVNPEEQHKYLGTFRERCYLSMTVAEMIQPKNKENFLKRTQKTSRCFHTLEWGSTPFCPKPIYPASNEKQ